MLKILKFTLLFILLPNICAADSSSEAGHTLVVTGTHLKKQAFSNSASKITITRKEIQQQVTNSVADIFRGIPGIDILQQGGLSGRTYLSMRGGDPNFVTIIIDGAKVNDPTNSRGGAFDFATLDPDAIDKIEIYFGSYSTLVGSDALSGIISITTIKADSKAKNYLTVNHSGSETYGFSSHHIIPLSEDIGLSFIASHKNGDNSTFSSGFERSQVIANLSSIQTDAEQWNVSFLFSEGESAVFPEDSGGERLAVLREPELKNFKQKNFYAEYQHDLNEKINIKYKGSWTERQATNLNPGIAPGVFDLVPAIDSHSNYQHSQFQTIGNILLAEDLNVALGIGWSKEEGELNSVIDFGALIPAVFQLERQTRSVFTEVGYKPRPDLAFVASHRIAQIESTKNTANRIDVDYKINSQYTLSSQFSEGYKTPSFFALGHPFVGNPYLISEESDNFDISLGFISEGFESRVSVYQNTFFNLIDFDPIAFTNVNRSKIETQGIEISTKQQFSKNITATGQVTFNKINLFEQQTQLRRRPKIKASVQLNYQLNDDWLLASQIIYKGDYIDSSIPTGFVEIESATHLNIFINSSLTNKVSLDISVNNLLNSDHESSVGFIDRGTNFMLRLGYRF